jgi:peptide/nickel transport system substrate-binding protein
MRQGLLVAVGGIAGLALLTAAPVNAEVVLNVGMQAQDMQSLDPHRASTTPDKAIVGWMFNGLVRFKPGTMNPEEIEPDLAESWDTSADQSAWTFHLRHGVQCNNGYGELTSEDVVFSLQRAADGKTSAYSSDFAGVQSFEGPDPYTVKITFKQRPPNVLGLLTNYQSGNIVCKKAVEKLRDDFRTQAVGTGPFAFAEYTPNQSVVLVANKSYFRGAPKIDRVVYKYIPSDATRDLAYQSGEIDLIYGRQDQTWAERMQKEPHTIVDVFGPGELSNISLNITKPPLDDLRVRQAIAYALNRKDLVKFKGELTAREAVSIVPHDYLGTDESAPLYPYDPAKAKQLLIDGGHPDGLTIKAIQTQLSTMLNTMQIVQAQLKKVGIDLQLDVVDHPTFHAQIRKDLSQVVMYSAARLPVADVYLTQFFHSRSIVGTPTAVTNFSHCDVADHEIDAARAETDVAKQKALWKDAQDKLVQQVCAVPLYEQLQVWAHRDKFAYGYKLDASLTLGPLINELSTLQP